MPQYHPETNRSLSAPVLQLLTSSSEALSSRSILCVFALLFNTAPTCSLCCDSTRFLPSSYNFWLLCALTSAACFALTIFWRLLYEALFQNQPYPPVLSLCFRASFTARRAFLTACFALLVSSPSHSAAACSKSLCGAVKSVC